ncbi:hypothetical protein ABZW30_38845 [Kitasatospora sp. NPDC004669]|uniref:hypothetical protein n=1 Tax=Kitasatospora sp. NPDC004669 TaxID=3154555 RepID=UPI0033AACD4C
MTLRRATTGRTAPDRQRDRPRAALTATALLPGLLLLGGCAAAEHGEPADPPSHVATSPKTADGALPGGLGDPATAPTGTPVFGPDGPGSPSYGGLGTLTSCHSGRRLAVLDAPPTEVPDGAPVGGTAPTGANGEEWLVWTEPDGGLVVQALLSSGAPVPRLLTAEPAGTAAVRDEATAGTPTAAAQRWQLTDRRPAPGRATADRSADCVLIRTQDGAACLLDHGAQAPLVVGDCTAREAWWSPQGLSAPTGS